MFDIHTHICHGVDDGSEDIFETLDMIELAQRCGTKGIVLTPHSNLFAQNKNYWSDLLYERLKSVRAAVNENNLPVKIYFGQEIFCDDNALDLLKKGYLITLNNSKYPLIEFDFNIEYEECYLKATSFLKEGYIPIIAHPERYDFVKEDYFRLNELKDTGCLFQINKGSLVGEFGRLVQVTANNLLIDNIASFVASDAHSLQMRNPDMSLAYITVKNEFNDDYAHLIFDKNPRLALENKDIIKY